MTDQTLHPSARTAHRGFFDATLPPALEVEDGDTVRLVSICGGLDETPPPEFGVAVDPAYRAVHEGAPRGPGPHVMTGPIAVRGAEPGDALRVEILDVALNEDWGFNLLRPLLGALPDDFALHSLTHLRIDRARGVIETPWGLKIPARPFFGVMGVAPPPLWGRVTSIVPRSFGGNIDCKELVAGTTLFLPVHVPGALFSAGDGHAVQGDGEACLTPVETGLRGLFRLSLVKGAGIPGPRAETPDHLIAMGFDPDLDRAARIALREAVAMIVERAGLDPVDAYRLCGMAVDLRVTQLVNEHKGVHAMIPRWAL